MPTLKCVTPARRENPVLVRTRSPGHARLKVTSYHLCEFQLLFLILTLPVWVSSGHSTFLLQSEGMMIRLTGFSKSPIGMIIETSYVYI